MDHFLCFLNQRIITEPLPGLLHDELPGISLCSKPLLYQGDDESLGLSRDRLPDRLDKVVVARLDLMEELVLVV